MNQYKPYAEYKDSGVAGLEQIPATWRVLSWKRALKAESGGTVIKNTAFSEPGENRFPAYSASGQDVWLSSYMFDVPGLVISAVGARCGRVFHAKEKWGVVANTACVFPKKNTDLRYMWYVVNQPDWWEIGGSAQPYVKISESLGRIGVLPPLPEQHAIATFLDRETAKIDALIEKKSKFIELLEEKRQALISHAVTKGLNPDAPMKDSGVPWLGEVPAHWEVMKVWHLFELGRGRVISHEYIHEHSGPYPVYSSQTKNDGILGYIDSYDFEGQYLTWTTDGANAGTVFKRDGRFSCTNVCGTLRQRKERFSNTFFSHQLNTFSAAHVRHDINPKLMNNVMASIRIFAPPLDEQKLILQKLEKKTSLFNEIQSQTQHSITLLREKRSALITAAVTGQIDVRDEVAS